MLATVTHELSLQPNPRIRLGTKTTKSNRIQRSWSRLKQNQNMPVNYIERIALKKLSQSTVACTCELEIGRNRIVRLCTIMRQEPLQSSIDIPKQLNGARE